MEILNAIKSQAKEWTELNPGNPETTKLNLKGRETAAEGMAKKRPPYYIPQLYTKIASEKVYLNVPSFLFL